MSTRISDRPVRCYCCGVEDFDDHDPVFKTFDAFIDSLREWPGMPTVRLENAADLRIAIKLALIAAEAEAYERGYAAGLGLPL